MTKTPIRLSFAQLSLLLVFVFTWPSICAQNEDKISLRFLSFPQASEFRQVELVVGEKQTIKVDTPGNELSKAYLVPPLGTIVVGESSTNEQGDPVFLTYGSAKSLGVKEQIILLLRKGQKDSDGFIVIPVNAGEKDFKPATYLFINASSLSVRTDIGDQKFALKPGEKKQVAPKPNHQDGICQVTFYYQKNDSWKTVYDTRWPANEKFRSIVFFYQHPETGRLGFVPIVDVLPFKEN